MAATLLHRALAAVAETWTADDPSICGESGSTNDIANCHVQRAKVWDTRLNDAYQAVISMLQDMQNPKQIAALTHAERLWLDYREANCAFYADGQGTISEILATDCMRRMTQDRAIELQEAGPQ